ncbi:hypothetical protein BDF21DRAFT_40011 [Thamnidium elegans]|nr:hypothetical protein BDF21DRAFT_40011 [Thamnidium elegans]
MTSVDGSVYDVMADEFSNSKLGPSNFTSDYLKVLRESKVILDHIVNQIEELGKTNAASLDHLRENVSIFHLLKRSYQNREKFCQEGNYLQMILLFRLPKNHLMRSSSSELEVQLHEFPL